MTQYHSVNVKLSDLKLDKLKSATKNATEVSLRLSSNMFGTEADFPYKLLLTDRQFSRLFKAFANKSLANIELSKTQLSEIIQSGGFLVRICGPRIEVVMKLIKNVFTILAKSVLMP